MDKKYFLVETHYKNNSLTKQSYQFFGIQTQYKKSNNFSVSIDQIIHNEHVVTVILDSNGVQQNQETLGIKVSNF